MKVEDIMTEVLAVCTPETDLAAVVRRMHRRCCGALPVIAPDKQVVGILTDRDVAISVGLGDAKPSKLRVQAVMSAPAKTCRASDTVSKALHAMEQACVRRLPVVNHEGVLVGMISIDDIILVARKSTGGGRISHEQAIAALGAICARSTKLST